ncbi:MAG TPA: alpha/beta hydrolase [Caulobacteraceae bacterium]|jgi:alpha-beta hydrolase superfamily lysophospholipase
MTRAVDHFRFAADDGAQIAAWRLAPEGRPRAIVQIAHGMAEHMARYERLGQALADAGFAVYANDHRGHGASADIHGLGDFGARGFPGVVQDMAALSHLAREEHSGAPLVLLGHSMGSFAAQLYLLSHGDDLAALVLSGTAAGDKLVKAIAAAGGGGRLESFNAAFEPARTPFDWLSRDPAEVDAYVADPLCGFELTQDSVQSVFQATGGATLDPGLAKAPKDLPVLVISGERDPVTGPGQAFVGALVDRYRAAGLDVEHRVYPGGRHELFNETNRDEVTADLIAWLDARIWGATSV